jgi:NADH-quinone oxidoreductase subunit D
MHIREEGDASARFCLRLDACAQALSYMEKLLEFFAKQPKVTYALESDAYDLKKPPHGIENAIIEAPEGMLAYSIVSNGEAKPYRVRIKTPSFALMAALKQLLEGTHMQDLASILHGLGIEGLELDR